MALKSAALASALEDLFEGAEGYPASEADAGKRWAEVYRSYAANAVAGTTAPVSVALGGAEETLAGTLAGGFTAAKAAGPGGVAALAAVMDAAFVAFWLAPPVAFAIPPTGPPTMTGVVSASPPGVLVGALNALFLAGVAQKPSAAQQAQTLAAALDGWTRTVMVINTSVVPPGLPLPAVPLA
jgi:hypothetical protein